MGKKRLRQEPLKWYRLDNMGLLYPLVITLSDWDAFLMKTDLDKDIDKDILAKALDAALERFPYYKVELSHGLFRYCFVENSRKPVINEYDGILLKNLRPLKNARYLFRISYQNNTVMAEIFHGLCDGRSAMEFFKTLIYYYLTGRGEQINPEKCLMLCGDTISDEEYEDGYEKYYTPVKTTFRSKLKNIVGGKAIKIRGTEFKKQGLGLIYGSVDTDELLKISKSYNCSLTVFITALTLLSAGQTLAKSKIQKQLIALVPIDLRRFYPSKTMHNFVTMAKCRVNVAEIKPNLADYIEKIQQDLEYSLQKKELDTSIALFSSICKNPFFKYIPLGIKIIIAKISRNLASKTKQTMVISNIGIVDMPEAAKPFIKNLVSAPNCNVRTPVNMVYQSFNGKTTFSFTREIVETEVERYFFNSLADMGLSVTVESNLREEDYAL